MGEQLSREKLEAFMWRYIATEDGLKDCELRHAAEFVRIFASVAMSFEDDLKAAEQSKGGPSI